MAGTSGVICRKIRRVRVSQVKPSNCFRSLEKLVLPFISDTSLTSLMMWNVHSYPTVLNARTWRLGEGVKTHFDPPTYFEGSRPSIPPPDLRPRIQTESQPAMMLNDQPITTLITALASSSASSAMEWWCVRLCVCVCLSNGRSAEWMEHQWRQLTSDLLPLLLLLWPWIMTTALFIYNIWTASTVARLHWHRSTAVNSRVQTESS